MKKLALMLLLVACEGRKQPEPTREPERQRRVIEPPSRGVRALPPHAIRADGVGPYKLGATIAALLDQLPSGPRITQFTLPGVIQRDIVRAEEDGILIGAEPQGKATFVSVVRSDIARTEAGVHVGSTRAELERSLGAPLDEPDRAIDPRVVIPSGLKNARVLLDGDDRIVAFVVATEPERPATGGKDSKDTRTEVARTSGYELSLLSRVPNLVFAAPLRNPNDGRDDYIAITKAADEQSATWSLVAYRLHEGKLVPVMQPTVLYQLTDANARWIGADIRDLELYLELASRADAIEVGGLLTTRAGGRIRDIVVISPVSVSRKRPKPTPHEPIDAGNPDGAALGSERPAR